MADNPKVESLIEEFGAVGYSIYCRFLEDLCRHGHVEIVVVQGDPPEVIETTWIGEVSIQSISKKLRLEEPLVEKVVKRIIKRFEIKIRKKTKYFVILSNRKVIEIMDEYTRRVVRKALTEAKCPDNVRIVSEQAPVNIRKEGKGREKKDLRSETVAPRGADPPGPKPKLKTEEVSDKEAEEIKKLILNMEKRFGKEKLGKDHFNPSKFINATAKRSDGAVYPMEVYIRIFRSMLKTEGIKKPWSYANALFRSESQNVNEERMIREHTKRSQAEKEFAESLGLRDLVGRME